MKKLLIIALFLAALTCPAFSQSDSSFSDSSNQSTTSDSSLTPHSSLLSPSPKASGYGLEWDNLFGWVYYSGNWAYVYFWGAWNYMGYYSKNSGGNIYDFYIGWFYMDASTAPYLYSWEDGLWGCWGSGASPYRAFWIPGFGWAFEYS